MEIKSNTLWCSYRLHSVCGIIFLFGWLIVSKDFVKPVSKTWKIHAETRTESLLSRLTNVQHIYIYIYICINLIIVLSCNLNDFCNFKQCRIIRLSKDDADALKSVRILTIYKILLIYIYIYIYLHHICCAFIGLCNKLYNMHITYIESYINILPNLRMH